MKLLINSIPDDFDPKRHIPIGLHCFAGREHIYSELDKIDFLKLDLNNDELHEVDELTAIEALRLVKIIAQKHHGEKYFAHSFRFWQIIYYPVIAIIVQSVYARQLLLEKHIEFYKDKKIEVDIAHGNTVFSCPDDEAVVNAISSVQFSAWIYSMMIENRMHESSWSLNKVGTGDEKFTYQFEMAKPNEWKHRIIEKLRIKYVYGFNAFDLLFFNLLTFRKVKTKPLPRKNYSEISNQPHVIWHTDIEFFLDMIIPHQYSQVLSSNFKTKQRLFDFSNVLFFDLNAKIQAAYATENGNTILSNQHGGHNYGSATTFEFNRYIEYDCDYHISWGPTEYVEDVNAIFIPLPSPLLSKSLDKHENRSGRLIWIGTALQITPIRMEYLFWNHAHNYRDVKKDVFSTLSQTNLWDSFFYRPYPRNEERYLSDEKFYKDNIPSLKILPGDLHTEVMHCNLLILDHPGTTWNIAMAMNTPLLLFWDKTWFPLNDNADSYLERFRELGIFFDDPYEMKDHIVKLYEEYTDFSQWWSNPEIQSLRKEWMLKYALADNRWRNKWVKSYLNF